MWKIKDYNMLKTPLRYPGGKTRSVDFITSKFPDFDEYREPFVGGCSVFLNLKERFPDKKYWINDLYDELYSFLHSCRYDSRRLIDAVKTIKHNTINGRELFDQYKKEMGTYTEDIDKAIAFFIINRISFSGTSYSGGYSETAFKERFTDTSIDRLEAFCKVLKPRLRVTNYDYSKVLRKKGSNVFIYCDPPYHSAEKSGLYGVNGNLHKGFDHERFAEEIKKCPHKWCISYDDSEYIKNLYDGYKIIPFESSYGMKNVNPEKVNQKGKEILILNY